jgi:hypothetical protein
VEAMPVLEGKRMIMFIAPKKKKKKISQKPKVVILKTLT